MENSSDPPLSLPLLDSDPPQPHPLLTLANSISLVSESASASSIASSSSPISALPIPTNYRGFSDFPSFAPTHSRTDSLLNDEEFEFSPSNPTHRSLPPHVSTRFPSTPSRFVSRFLSSSPIQLNSLNSLNFPKLNHSNSIGIDEINSIVNSSTGGDERIPQSAAAEANQFHSHSHQLYQSFGIYFSSASNSAPHALDPPSLNSQPSFVQFASSDGSLFPSSPHHHSSSPQAASSHPNSLSAEFHSSDNSSSLAVSSQSTNSLPQEILNPNYFIPPATQFNPIHFNTNTMIHHTQTIGGGNNNSSSNPNNSSPKSASQPIHQSTNSQADRNSPFQSILSQFESIPSGDNLEPISESENENDQSSILNNSQSLESANLSSSATSSSSSSSSSCHHCKSRRPDSELIPCVNRVRSQKIRKSHQKICRKRYCINCLLKKYGEMPMNLPLAMPSRKKICLENNNSASQQNQSKKNEENQIENNDSGNGNGNVDEEIIIRWNCPSCRNICYCASCKRSGSGNMQPNNFQFNRLFAAHGASIAYPSANFHPIQHTQIHPIPSAAMSTSHSNSIPIPLSLSQSRLPNNKLVSPNLLHSSRSRIPVADAIPIAVKASAIPIPIVK